MSFRNTFIAPTEDEKIFLAQIIDMIKITRNRNVMKFSSFLNEREAILATNCLNREMCSNFTFFGGYDDATRKILGIFPDYINEHRSLFPIKPLTFTYKKEYNLSHRDFLGALMSLQVKRDVIGDILVGEGRTVAFVKDSISPLILNEVSKIGRIGVSVERGISCDLPTDQNYEEIDGTVSSLRLDCVVSLATRLSRGKASSFIKSSGVILNHIDCYDCSKSLIEGDVLSIKGYGKYKLSSIGGNTKKGRIHISIKKYK